MAFFKIFLIVMTFFSFAIAADGAQNTSKVCKPLLEMRDISPEWVSQQIEKDKQAEPSVEQLRRAVRKVGFGNVAYNADVLRDHNNNYTVELTTGPRTNQKQSGRCWIFAAVNTLRSHMISDGKVPADFEFSEAYPYFFMMLEKTNYQLQKVQDQLSGQGSLNDSKIRSKISPGIGDGGWFHYFSLIVAKYGLVPKAAMPETVSSASTALLQRDLVNQMAVISDQMLALAHKHKTGKKRMTPDQQKELAAIKWRGLEAIWDILVTHLGTPPVDFEFRTLEEPVTKGNKVSRASKVLKLSPQKFAKEIAQFDPNDYVIVSSSPNQPMNKLYQLPVGGMTVSKQTAPFTSVKTLNLPIERLENLVTDSIDAGEPVWFASEMGEATDVARGVGILNSDLIKRDEVYNFKEKGRKTKLSRERGTYFSTSQLNHAMAFTGYDRPDPKGPVLKFKVENSWGDDTGNDGFLAMYRNWFYDNVYQVVVHKSLLDEKELSLLNGKAKELKNDGELW